MNNPQKENQNIVETVDTEPSLSYSEQYVRSILAKDLNGYFRAELKLVQEEYSVPGVGRIDILATDVKGDFVVIEIKKVSAGRDAVGQLLSYMGALGDKGKKVRGYLVAPSFDEACIAASKVSRQVRLLKLGVVLQVNLSNATGQTTSRFLRTTIKTSRTSEGIDHRLTWTLNLKTMKLSSTLPFVNSPITIRNEHVVKGKGINTNWGFVPFSEISLEGRKNKVAQFVKRHKLSKSRSSSTADARRDIPTSTSQSTSDVGGEPAIASAWPFPKDKHP